ncbi:MAG: MliC family protein [Wenzhouxiangella sp.]|nr:MliC family protein [Wenzhouxiangella sp.]
MKRLAIVLAVLVLAACQRSADEPAPVAEALEVRVQAHYLERIMLPPGSWLQAELFDEQADELVAAQRSDEAVSPPFDVQITVAAGNWQPEGEYRLYLTLNLPDGRPRFSAELPVSADQPDLGEVRLVAVDLHEAGRESLRWVGYRCGEVPVDFLALDDGAILVLPWADIELEQVVAASGARYAGGDVEFWTRGQDEARLTLDDEQAQACHRSEGLSPWTRARQNGVHFRATGNEPGWLVEVGGGGEPSVSLSLDYGSRMLDFDEASWDQDRMNLTADSPGNHLEIALTETECVDSMVGWTFPLRVEMRLNDTSLQACGRFLEDMPEE